MSIVVPLSVRYSLAKETDKLELLHCHDGATSFHIPKDEGVYGT